MYHYLKRRWGFVSCSPTPQSTSTILHVELDGADAAHTVPLPDGWTCIVYVRKGSVRFGGESGGGGGGGEEPTVAKMHDTVYTSRRGGDCVALANAHSGLTDVLVLAGQPLGAPVVASGTMVMNSEADVQQALFDYRRGDFGVPWEHTLNDEEWAARCDERVGARRG